MINLIENLLTKTGFNVENNETGKFAYSDDNSMYYVLKDYNSIDEFRQKIYESQNNFFDFISSKHNSNEMKKNTSFIIFIKLNDIKEKELIQSQILELEEDTYYFKKYVITYTKEEIEDFKEKAKSYNDIIEFIMQSLNDEISFEDFKINNTVSYYSLILKLFIKVPHLSYKNIFKKIKIENLMDKIKRILAKKDLIDYYNKISSIDACDIDSYINSIVNSESEVI